MGPRPVPPSRPERAQRPAGGRAAPPASSGPRRPEGLTPGGRPEPRRQGRRAVSRRPRAPQPLASAQRGQGPEASRPAASPRPRAPQPLASAQQEQEPEAPRPAVSRRPRAPQPLASAQREQGAGGATGTAGAAGTGARGCSTGCPGRRRSGGGACTRRDDLRLPLPGRRAGDVRSREPDDRAPGHDREGQPRQHQPRQCPDRFRAGVPPPRRVAQGGQHRVGLARWRRGASSLLRSGAAAAQSIKNKTHRANTVRAAAACRASIRSAAISARPPFVSKHRTIPQPT